MVGFRLAFRSNVSTVIWPLTESGTVLKRTRMSNGNLSAPRRLWTWAVAGGVLLGLTAAGSAPAAHAGSTGSLAAGASGTDPVSMNVALLGTVDSLNPFIGVLSDATTIHRIQYEPLVAWGPEDNAEHPAIAESWEANENGSEWTYTLAPDDKWSDGEPITAEDVVWTLNSMLEKSELQTAFGAYVSGIKTVEQTDEETVVITLEEGQASNPGTDIPIVPEHVWSGIDNPGDYANDSNVIGSGPFTVESSSSTSGITMVANPNYRGGDPAVSRINWVPYRNSDAGAQALRAGEIDLMTGLTVAQHEALEGNDTIESISADGRGFRGLQINPGARDINDQPMGDGHPALEDVRVRQAIVHAINREVLTERILQGYGTPGGGIIPPMYPRYHLEPNDDGILSFDPNRSRELLDEAGLELGPDGIRLDENGNPLQLRLESYDHPAAQQTLDFLGGWLRDVGIDTTTAITSMAQYNDDTVLGTYDLYISGWTVRPDPDYLFAMNRCTSRPESDGTGATSLANACNEEFDALYARQAVEVDPGERAELIREMQSVLEQDAVFPVFFYPQVFEAYRSDRVENLVKQPRETGAILGQSGGWSLASAQPAGMGSDTVNANTVSESRDSRAWLWILGAAAVVAALILILVRRRSASSADNAE